IGPIDGPPNSLSRSAVEKKRVRELRTSAMPRTEVPRRIWVTGRPSCASADAHHPLRGCARGSEEKEGDQPCCEEPCYLAWPPSWRRWQRPARLRRGVAVMSATHMWGPAESSTTGTPRRWDPTGRIPAAMSELTAPAAPITLVTLAGIMRVT